MKLGLPAATDEDLGRRLVSLTFFRLVVLVALLVLIERFYLRELPFGGFSTTVAIWPAICWNRRTWTWS